MSIVAFYFIHVGDRVDNGPSVVPAVPQGPFFGSINLEAPVLVVDVSIEGATPNADVTDMVAASANIEDPRRSIPAGAVGVQRPGADSMVYTTATFTGCTFNTADMYLYRSAKFIDCIFNDMGTDKLNVVIDEVDVH